MGQFAADSFAGAAGTELAAYNSAWAKVTGLTTNAVITAAGRLRAGGGSTLAYRHTTAPASADYSVSCDIYVASLENATAGPAARVNSSVQTLYFARWWGNSGGLVQLWKTVAGTSTQIGGNVARAAAAGSTVNLRLEVSGTSVRVYIDGAATPAISQTDSAISAAGSAGFRFSPISVSDTAGVHIYNWGADEQGAAGALTAALTESVSAADGAAAVAALLAAIADTSAAGDAATATGQALAALVEAATAGDDAVAVAALLAALAEAVLPDAVALGAFSALPAVFEAAAAGDDLAAAAQLLAALSESAGAADASGARLDAVALQAEAAALAEQLLGTVPQLAGITESAQLTELLAGVLGVLYARAPAGSGYAPGRPPQLRRPQAAPSTRPGATAPRREPR